MPTTIQIEKNTKQQLDSLKVHPRESYNEVISRLTTSRNVENGEESMNETIAVLSDATALREIAEALEHFSKGKGKTLQQLEQELGL